MNEANLPLEEMKKRLIEKVKEDKEQINVIESRIKDVRRFVDAERKKIYEYEQMNKNESNLNEKNK